MTTQYTPNVENQRFLDHWCFPEDRAAVLALFRQAVANSSRVDQALMLVRRGAAMGQRLEPSGVGFPILEMLGKEPFAAEDLAMALLEEKRQAREPSDGYRKVLLPLARYACREYNRRGRK